MAQENQQQQPSATNHNMPAWFEKFRTRYVLSALVVSQALVTTMMVLMVSVSDPTKPWLWSWIDCFNAVIAVLIGFSCGGLSLALSSTMAESFAMRQRFKGLFCFLGMVSFFCADVWSGIAERSVVARPTNADLLLAQLMDVSQLKIIPVSVFIVSFLLACLILYYGWTNRPPETQSAAEARRARELADAQHRAEMRKYGGGLGAAIAANIKAAKQGLSDDQGEARSEENSEPLAAENVIAFPGQDEDGLMGKRAPVSRGKRAGSPKGGLPGTHWRDSDILAYIHDELGRVDVPISEVKKWMSVHHKAEQANGSNSLGISLPGGPYFMHKSTARSEAKKKWPPQPEAVAVAD